MRLCCFYNWFDTAEMPNDCMTEKHDCKKRRRLHNNIFFIESYFLPTVLTQWHVTAMNHYLNFKYGMIYTLVNILFVYCVEKRQTYCHSFSCTLNAKKHECQQSVAFSRRYGSGQRCNTLILFMSYNVRVNGGIASFVFALVYDVTLLSILPTPHVLEPSLTRLNWTMTRKQPHKRVWNIKKKIIHTNMCKKK